MLSSAIWCPVHSVTESGGVPGCLDPGHGRDTGRTSVITVAASKRGVGKTVGATRPASLGRTTPG